MIHDAILGCKFNFSNVLSTELFSKMMNAQFSQSERNNFFSVWPNDVRSFLLAISDDSNDLIGMGIFYRRDSFITNSDCLTGSTSLVIFPAEKRNPATERRLTGVDYRETSNGIIMAFVSIYTR